MVKFIEGLDHYLFLANDTNDVLQQTKGEYPFTEELADRIWACHVVRRFICERQGASYRHVIIPNKETVYAAKLPQCVAYEGFGPTPVNRWFSRLPCATEISFWEPAALAVGRDGTETFPRTDTHWNMPGALRYLRAALAYFQDAAKLAELDGLDLITPDPTLQTGDLGVHAGRPPELVPTVWPRNPTARVRFESPAPRFGYVRHYTNAGPVVGHRRALILHDSFVGWMLPFLAELYAEIVMLLCPDLDPLLIQQLRPDVVWFFQCERFFVRCPSNELAALPWVAAKEREAETSLSGTDYLAGLLAEAGP
jgi:alginate O-acetyltransferase complex protein AlgJ